MSNKNKGKKQSYFTPHSIFKDGSFFRGVLVSCQKNQEKFAVRDTYRVLNDHFEENYDQCKKNTIEESIEKQVVLAMEAKTDELEVKVHQPKVKLFNQIKVEATGLIFVKFDNDLFPSHLLVKDFVEEIFEKSIKSQKTPSKFYNKVNL